MRLLEETLGKEDGLLMEHGLRLRSWGRKTSFPEGSAASSSGSRR